MTVNGEDEVKKALGIRSLRSLAKVEPARLVAYLPQLDPKVMTAIVAKIPDVSQLLDKLMNHLRQDAAASRASLDAHQARLHEARLLELEACVEELKRDDLSAENRGRLLDRMTHLQDQLGIDDVRYKEVMLKLRDPQTGLAVAAVAVVLLMMGARIALQRPAEDDSQAGD